MRTFKIYSYVTLAGGDTVLKPTGTIEYYCVLFHEIGHWTGHESRLNRKGITDKAMFGSHTYSKEELVAEMTSAFLCGVTGIDNVTLDNSAAYLQAWIKALKGDSKLLISAAACAQKAANLILNKQADKQESEAA